MPDSAAQLRTSADLGRRVANLLDCDSPVIGVTAGPLEPVFRTIAVFAKRDGSAASGTDFSMSVRWGSLTNGAVMPGKGQVTERSYSPAEAECEAKRTRLGEKCLDIHINDATLWRNVPEEVWDFTIGGYQVLKKWLSYRQVSILGRPLSTVEVRHFTDVARRLAALRLLGEELDANYTICADNAFNWSSLSSTASAITVPAPPLASVIAPAEG